MAKGASIASGVNESGGSYWTKPDPDFYIDRAVEKLVLRPNFEDNPYLTARCYLGRAIESARNAERKEKALRAAKLELQKVSEIAQLARAVLESRPAVDRAFAITTRTATPDPMQMSAQKMFLDAVEKIALPEEAIPRVVSKDAKTFLAAFIEEMAYCWVRLTGEIPGPAEKAFAHFVDQAHRTLGAAACGDLQLPFYVKPWATEAEERRYRDINRVVGKKRDGWSWQIRNALNDMASRRIVDRADRYEIRFWRGDSPIGTEHKGFWPSGVGRQPLPIEATRKWANPTLLDDDETRRLISVMNVGGEVGRAAASVLWTEFELGSEKRRQRYLDLDFNTADATAILSPGVPYHVVAPGAPDDDEAAD